MKISQLVSALQRDPQQNQGVAQIANAVRNVNPNWQSASPVRPVNRPQPTPRQMQPIPRPMQPIPRPMQPAPPQAQPVPQQIQAAFQAQPNYAFPSPVPLPTQTSTMPYQYPQDNMMRIPPMEMDAMTKLQTSQQQNMTPPVTDWSNKQLDAGAAFMPQSTQPQQPMYQTKPMYQPMIRRF